MKSVWDHLLTESFAVPQDLSDPPGLHPTYHDKSRLKVERYLVDGAKDLKYAIRESDDLSHIAEVLVDNVRHTKTGNEARKRRRSLQDDAENYLKIRRGWAAENKTPQWIFTEPLIRSMIAKPRFATGDRSAFHRWLVAVNKKPSRESNRGKWGVPLIFTKSRMDGTEFARQLVHAARWHFKTMGLTQNYIDVLSMSRSRAIAVSFPKGALVANFETAVWDAIHERLTQLVEEGELALSIKSIIRWAMDGAALVEHVIETTQRPLFIYFHSLAEAFASDSAVENRKKFVQFLDYFVPKYSRIKDFRFAFGGLEPMLKWEAGNRRHPPGMKSERLRFTPVHFEEV